jgi:hypothetical protein
MYTVDLFRNGQFLVCLGHYSNQNHAINRARSSWEQNHDKPENAGISWQVNQQTFDGEGEPDSHVTIFSREAK